MGFITKVQSSIVLILWFQIFQQLLKPASTQEFTSLGRPSSQVFSAQGANSTYKKKGKYRMILLPVYPSRFMQSAIWILLQVEIVIRFIFKTSWLHHPFEYVYNFWISQHPTIFSSRIKCIVLCWIVVSQYYCYVLNLREFFKIQTH